MVMTTLEPRTEVATVVWGALHCGKTMLKDKGKKRAGDICGALLCRIDVDRWEEALTDAVEHYCDRCEQTYTLAEYR